MDVLVLNVGSSSFKVQVLGDGDGDGDGDERRVDEELDLPVTDAALGSVLARCGPVDAVGHRIVHGGPDHVQPEVVTDALLDELDALVPLAPLHLPPALEVVRAVRRARPDLPAVACYDTAFHATIPPAAHLYGLPPEWEDEHGLRRYGFHGLSHRYLAHRAAEMLGRHVGELKVVTCHLGSGASLAAVDGGRSVDTTMGFTPLAGVVMATRSGDVDPGALLWLQGRTGLDAASAEDALWHRAGLLGLSRRSGDVREVLAGADAGDERCAVAVAVYVHRLRAAVASMAAAMDGVDVVVFSGGVGEHSARIRAEVVAGLGFLGLSLDAEANAEGQGDRDVTGPGATVLGLVVRTREDVEIARQVRAVLA